MTCLAGCVLMAAASLVRAQPLADKVPADAMLYFGWAGADAARASGFEGSHLQSVLAESRVHELFGSYLDTLEQQIVSNEPGAAEPFRIARTLGAPMWKYPSAVAVQRVANLNSESPTPVKVLLISKAGAEAQTLADEWAGVIANVARGGDVVNVTASGEYVVATIGYGGEAATLADGVNGLLKTPGFADAMKRSGAAASPVMVGYFDVEAAIKLAEDAIAIKEADRGPAPQGQRDPSEQVKAFLDASGLRGVKRVVGSAGFEGKDWVTTRFIHAPGTRTGLLTAWPDGAVDAALLKAVPADASFVSTVRFDPAVFIKQMQATLGKTDPAALRGFNQGVGAVQAALGTNMVANVLEPLGPDWVFYNAPRVGSGSFMGVVAANKPEDPEKLRKALNAVSVSLANWANVGLDNMDMVSQAQADSGVGGVRAQQVEIGGAKVTYLTTPIISPAWAIEDGWLYVGLYPQTVGAAVRQAKKNGPSILDNEKYKAAVARLGVTPGTTTFNDVPAAAPFTQMYTSMLVIGRYAGIADLFGPPLPEPILPPIDVLLDHVSPAISANWSDADGWHSKSIVSFPGSTLLTEQGALSMIGGPGGAALSTSILLPSLNRARETANRVKSASNLRQMGLGMMMYANENRGKYPADLGELVKTQDLAVDVFVSPRTSTSIPPDARTGEAAIAFVNTNADYVYLGKGLDNRANAEQILAYEKPDELEDGINILYADGHVEFQFMGAAIEEIEKQKQARGIE